MLSTANQNRLKIMAILVLAIFCALIVYPKLPTGTPLENFWNKFKFIWLEKTSIWQVADNKLMEKRTRTKKQ